KLFRDVSSRNDSRARRPHLIVFAPKIAVVRFWISRLFRNVPEFPIWGAPPVKASETTMAGNALLAVFVALFRENWNRVSLTAFAPRTAVSAICMVFSVFKKLYACEARL